MASETRAGRPRASSRETLAEAACELFLEQGYDDTSIVDITRRAGVSRSSFFNYFSSKSDVLWSGLDARIAVASVALAALGTDADGRSVRAALEPIVQG
ncbi:MAG: helix-turn-helix domain-containing protein, partial [Microbacterium sp.]